MLRQNSKLNNYVMTIVRLLPFLRKCTRYWPAQGSEEYGNVQVTLLEQTAHGILYASLKHGLMTQDSVTKSSPWVTLRIGETDPREGGGVFLLLLTSLLDPQYGAHLMVLNCSVCPSTCSLLCYLYGVCDLIMLLYAYHRLLLLKLF